MLLENFSFMASLHFLFFGQKILVTFGVVNISDLTMEVTIQIFLMNLKQVAVQRRILQGQTKVTVQLNRMDIHWVPLNPQKLATCKWYSL